MADTYYAWSNFPHAGKKVGDQISQSDLEDTSDEDWQDLVDAGAVRTKKYPEDIRPGESPREYFLRNASEAEGALTVEQVNTPSTEETPAPAPASAGNDKK